jgi:hypothetical protein
MLGQYSRTGDLACFTIVQIGPGYSHQHSQVLASTFPVNKVVSRTAAATDQTGLPPGSVMNARGSIACVPDAVQREASCSGAPLIRDRHSPQRSRVCSAPLRHSASKTRVNARMASCCAAPGTRQFLCIKASICKSEDFPPMTAERMDEARCTRNRRILWLACRISRVSSDLSRHHGGRLARKVKAL